MNEFLGKLSAYNIFNYLLTGVLFVAVSEIFTPYSFAQNDPLFAPFVYYFIGLVLSRLGSLVIEPILKFVKFVKFEEYSNYVRASRVDPLIETLSEANNMYRTFIALFVALTCLKLYAFTSQYYPLLLNNKIHLLLALLLIMFIFAYKKQTTYISKRILTK